MNLPAGFGDHDELLSDLTIALDPGAGTSVLVVVELAGSSEHRDAFGTLANDKLVAHLAQRLTQVVESGARYYRPRRDEFCVLIPGDLDEVGDRLAAIESALNAEDERSQLSAQLGVAYLPSEAGDATELLIVADENLRSRSASRRPRERRNHTRPL